MLAVPVLRRKRCDKNVGKVLAVIQMINKMEFDGEVGKFDDEDIQVMETFATFVASRLEGSSLLEKTSHKKDAADTEAHRAFGEADDMHKHGVRKSLGPSVDPNKIQEQDEDEEEEIGE